MPERLIDVPIESLPRIDEHSIEIAASQEEVWEGLLEAVPQLVAGRGSSRIAAALGCLHTERSGELGRIGSTVPGFVVSRSIPPAVLALLGQHRFARYALIFRLVGQPSGLTRLAAETRATFPGVAGRAYRTLVIGTRGHVLATNHILRSVRKRAERTRFGAPG